MADDWSDQSGSCWSWLWWFLKKREQEKKKRESKEVCLINWLYLHKQFLCGIECFSIAFLPPVELLSKLESILTTATEANLGVFTLYAVVDLLTPDCGKGKVRAYCRARQEGWADRAQKTKLLNGFQGRVFKGKMMEMDRVHDHLCTLFWLVWWWGNRVMFLEPLLSTFWF